MDKKNVKMEVINPNCAGIDIGSRSHFVAVGPVSYTHLRAHETVLDLVCRLLLEKKKHNTPSTRHKELN